MMDVPKTGLVLVDFYTTFCGPCKKMEGVLSEVGKKWGNKVQIVKVDCEMEPKLAESYGVCSVPTLLLFKDGVVRNRHVGTIQEPELSSVISTL